MTLPSEWKIDDARLRAIIDLDKVAKEMDVPYLLVGATAIDLIDGNLGVSPSRMTNDIDMAIMVESWEAFDSLTELLLQSGNFTRKEETGHRFWHISTNLPADIIPFGQIDGADHSILWPPQKEFGMSTLGFREAFDSSMDLCISRNPELSVRVPSRAGLAIMKIIAWNESAARTKDAPDLLHLIRNYDKSNESRLFDEHSDMNSAGLFDYECATAELLGRDMGHIASPEVWGKIKVILTEQLDINSDYRLIFDMISSSTESEYRFEEALKLARCLTIGFQEHKGK